jgi:hypothetical protein
MGRRQGTGAIELQQDLGHVASHEVASQPTDA